MSSRNLRASTILGLVVVGLATALITNASGGGIAGTRVGFRDTYGAKLARCRGAQRLVNGGFDLRVIGMSCARGKRLVKRYSVHPADRVESVGSFGCYAYRPRTGPAAQRIICLDPRGGEAFRFDVG